MAQIKQLMGSTFEQIRKRYCFRDSLPGIPTGFYDFDSITCGLQRSNLIVIGGRPSMGTTAFCCNVALHAGLVSKSAVGYFFGGESIESLTMRMLQITGKVEANRLRSGYLHGSDWRKLKHAKEELADAPLYFEDLSLSSAETLPDRCRILVKEENVELLIVDPIEAVRDVEDLNDRRSILSSLKKSALELDVPIIAAMGLKNSIEERKNKRPRISDVLEAESADLVVLVYRDEYYNQDTEQKGEAEIIVLRQRHGPTGTVALQFNASVCRYYNKAESY